MIKREALKRLMSVGSVGEKAIGTLLINKSGEETVLISEEIDEIVVEEEDIPGAQVRALARKVPIQEEEGNFSRKSRHKKK